MAFTFMDFEYMNKKTFLNKYISINKNKINSVFQSDNKIASADSILIKV